MNFHLEGQIVQITVPHTDAGNAVVIPTAMTAVLYDGENVVLADLGAITFDANQSGTVIVILGALNMLQGDDLKEARRLEVEITHAGGVVRKTHFYGVEDERSLVIMNNSFQTFETAQVNALGFVNLSTFAGASEDRQKAALIEAYRAITSLPMIYTISDPETGSVTSSYSIDADSWNLVTADVYHTQFPSHFKRALRMAQIAEADELLQGNVVARKHAQGIATETVGESSVTLRAGFGGGVSNRISATAMALLSGYINTVVKIGRA